MLAATPSSVPAVSSSRDRRARQWVWTSVGFGEVIRPADSSSSDETSSDGERQNQQEHTEEKKTESVPEESVSSLESSPSSSSVPTAPPLAPPLRAAAAASSPALSLNQLLSRLHPTPPVAAPVAIASPPLPAVCTSGVPASCVSDAVAVHLLPHYARPSTAAIKGGASPTPSPNHPTIIYTPRTRVYSRVRVRVRTFFELGGLMAKSADSPSTSQGGLARTLGRELRARKERMDAERAARDRESATPESGAVSARDSLDQSSRESAESTSDAAKPTRPSDAKTTVKPTSPPPQTMTITVDAGESIRGLIQQVIDFYSPYGIDLDADSIRLVANGKEITRSESPELDGPVVTPLTEVANPPGVTVLKLSKSPSGGVSGRLLQEVQRISMQIGAAGTTVTKAITQTDRERFFREHTMIAECGLAPATDQSAGADSAVASTAAVSADGTATITGDSAPPIFDVLLVYDEVSRFTFDASICMSDVLLTSDLLGATMHQGDNRWCTVRANKAFTSGRHLWKVRLDRCAGGNVFLGVATDKMKLNNYIGNDSHGYGYYGCGNTYRLGSSSSYGHGYRTGDTITCRLDMDRRTLSFDKNDTQLGVAFTDLPDVVYPACSLYSKNDHIQLVEFGTF